MNRATLIWRSLRHHRLTHLAVLLGVVVATAVLTGALLVGDSMRASLRQTALGRLAGVERALVTTRFISAEATTALQHMEGASVTRAILLRGGVTHAEQRKRVENIQVFGVDESFAALPAGPAILQHLADENAVVLNAALAAGLSARVGQDVLLRFGRSSAISPESLLGRRDQTSATLRLTVSGIVPDAGAGELSLTPQPGRAPNAYVALSRLQRALEQPGRINAVLVSSTGQALPSADALRQALKAGLAARDIGLQLRTDERRAYVSVESASLMLDPPLERAARAAAEEERLPAQGVLAYLANRIAVVHPPPTTSSPTSAPSAFIPYSTVAGIESTQGLQFELDASDPLGTDGIVLNRWAADQLGAGVGNRVRLTYYVTGAFGELHERSAEFKLTGIAPLSAVAADPKWVPEYPGITDSEEIADWDPPFPVDLSLVRPADERYWQEHRTTPKAFISLNAAQRLWADRPEQLGRLTSLRLTPPEGEDAAIAAERFSRAFLQQINPDAAGLRFDDVRTRALRASRGTTDIGGLFIGFSLFLIAAAAMLILLLFRLGGIL